MEVLLREEVVKNASLDGFVIFLTMNSFFKFVIIASYRNLNL